MHRMVRDRSTKQGRDMATATQLAYRMDTKMWRILCETIEDDECVMEHRVHEFNDTVMPVSDNEDDNDSEDMLSVDEDIAGGEGVLDRGAEMEDYGDL